MYEIQDNKKGIKKGDGAVVCEEHVLTALSEGYTIHGHTGSHSPVEKCPGGECFLCAL